MTSVSHANAMYATKRRRRNSKNVRSVCKQDSQTRSNPSKRHRERLNQELDNLASLLPFEQSVLSKLDKLSILRLSVSYLRTKSYFQAALSSSQLLGQQQARAPHQHYHHQFDAGSQQQLEAPTPSEQHYPSELRLEGDLIVQALNGFLLILTCDGEVFYTSHTVETYLGFHQSVYELVHSEDREELMQQLEWNSMIPQGSASNPLLEGATEQAKSVAQMNLHEVLASADHRHLLERNFTVRFRCLLDNTSGFLRLDIRGRIKVLHGQNHKQALASGAKKQQQQHHHHHHHHHQQSADGMPTLAFFGVCIPFGPPSLLEMPSKDSVFKSKHRLDLSIISMDSRGRQLLGLNDLNCISKQPTSSNSPASLSGSSSPVQAKFTPTNSQHQVKLEATSGKAAITSNATKQQQNISAYDLVHHDDLSYLASAHQELLKTGASGLIAYRMVTRNEGKHQWLQTSAKLYYKNSKLDFILCTHRPLMEEEGRDLLGKRTMDFKVSYLDVGLSSINDRIMACDKFSSLQALGCSGSSSARSKSPSRAHLATSSPLNSSGSTSRSLAGSPSTLTDEPRNERQKRKYTYDLNSNHQTPTTNSNNQHQQQQYQTDEYGTPEPNQQHLAEFGPSSGNILYDNHFKRSQNGDIYDMDSTAADSESASRKSNKKKLTKSTGKQAAKKRDLQLIDTHSTDQLILMDGSKAVKKYSVNNNTNTTTTTTNNKDQLHHHHQQVDQQLHLYNHYNHYNQHHHHEPDSYPAIQAAAVYAASLAHPHSTSVSQQGSYGSSHYSNHANSQSLYGGSSMMSPSSGYSQHHSHLHHLDSSNYQPSSHYGAFTVNHQPVSQTSAYQAGSAAAAVAAASSFLPTEHLLHHYSQSARSLAGWPNSSSGQSMTGASSTPSEYQHQHTGGQNQTGYTSSTGSGWSASAAAAAAAAALVASASTNDIGGKRESESAYSPNQDHYRASEQLYTQPSQVQQHLQHNSSPVGVEPTTSPATKPAPSSQQRYTNLMSHQHQPHPQKTHGPASLTSDGSAHRSPLSSSESSNGSGSLTAAQAAASAMAASSDSASMISPSAYYLNEHNQQFQHQQHSHQHQQPSYAGHHSQHLAAYHHSHYSAAQVQYGDTSVFNQHHHYNHQHQQQQVNSNAAYFQHAAGELTGNGSSSAKLYGANGETVLNRTNYMTPSPYGLASGISHNEQPNGWSSSSYPVQEATYRPDCVKHKQTVVTDYTEPSSTSLRLETKQIEWSGDSHKEHNFTYLPTSSASSSGGSSSSKVNEQPEEEELEEYEEVDEDDEDEECAEPDGEGQVRPEASFMTPGEKSLSADEDDQRDSLAQLISSTIGDIMLDIAPKN